MAAAEEKEEATRVAATGDGRWMPRSASRSPIRRHGGGWSGCDRRRDAVEAVGYVYSLLGFPVFNIEYRAGGVGRRRPRAAVDGCSDARACDRCVDASPVAQACGGPADLELVNVQAAEPWDALIPERQALRLEAALDAADRDVAAIHPTAAELEARGAAPKAWRTASPAA